MERKETRGIRTVIAAVGLLLAGQTLQAVEDGWQFQYRAGDGLKMGDGDNEIHLQGRVQGRFTYNLLEAAADSDTFAIQRGKIKIEGFTLDRRLGFGFQANFSTRNDAASGVATLEDYFVDYLPADWFGIKVGQFKVPFLMQELTSSGKQQFVDRSLSTGFFNLNRDIGLSLHGDLRDERFNYSLFAMNGDGANTINRNRSLMVGTRVEHSIFGEYKPSESDVDDSEGSNLGWGTAVAFNESGAAAQNATITAGTKTLNGTVDAGYKYNGFSVQTAGMITRALDTAKLTNWGYNAQAGYFLIPKTLEAAVRGAGTIFSDAVTNQYEYALGLNYFIKGHGIKFQTDYALLLNNRGLNLNDHRVRTQAQVIF